jgi:hypothetical protein
MTKPSGHKASIPNPALDGLKLLVGEWTTEGTHPLVPDTILHGRSSFRWIEGGAFIIWYSKIDKEGFPSGTAIFGSDADLKEFYMLYFDEREVSRKYDVSVHDNSIKWSRNAPNFSQRYTWTFADDGNTIIQKGELSKDGKTWESDLNLTFTRIT